MPQLTFNHGSYALHELLWGDKLRFDHRATMVGAHLVSKPDTYQHEVVGEIEAVILMHGTNKGYFVRIDDRLDLKAQL